MEDNLSSTDVSLAGTPAASPRSSLEEVRRSFPSSVLSSILAPFHCLCSTYLLHMLLLGWQLRLLRSVCAQSPAPELQMPQSQQP